MVFRVEISWSYHIDSPNGRKDTVYLVNHSRVVGRCSTNRLFARQQAFVMWSVRNWFRNSDKITKPPPMKPPALPSILNLPYHNPLNPPTFFSTLAIIILSTFPIAASCFYISSVNPGVVCRLVTSPSFAIFRIYRLRAFAQNAMPQISCTGSMPPITQMFNIFLNVF
jgi:hypothetical protein